MNILLCTDLNSSESNSKIEPGIRIYTMYIEYQQKHKYGYDIHFMF